MPKSSKLTDEEIAFIRENSNVMSAKEMAAHINRDFRTVRKYIKMYGCAEYGAPAQEAKELNMLKQFEREINYGILQTQLSAEEFEYFKKQWVASMKQFADTGGINHIEKQQLVDLIRDQILLDRSITREYEYIERVKKLKLQLVVEEKKENPDKNLIRSLNEQINMLDAAQSQNARAMKDYYSNINKLRELLKVTRDQRLKNIVDSKKDFVSLVKLLEEESRIHQEGQKIVLFRYAMERERERLTKYHTYLDGSEDIPFLTPELVEKYKIENRIV